MSEVSARTLLEHLEIETLALIIDDLIIVIDKLRDSSKESDPMYSDPMHFQDLNDALTMANDIHVRRIIREAK